MFFLLRRGRCCVWLAGTVVYNADESDSWSDSDYGMVFTGFLTSTQTAGIMTLYVRTCSRTSRVTALRMGGIFHALGRANSCCVTLNSVAVVDFANVIEQKFPSRVLDNPCSLMDSPSRSRIRRKMLRFWLFRDGLCLCAFCAAAHIEPKGKVFAPRRTSLYFGRAVIQCVFCGAS